MHGPGEEDGEAIEMAFSKKKVEDRKAWLTAFEPGTFLDMAADDLSYQDFVNKARRLLLLLLLLLLHSSHLSIDAHRPADPSLSIPSRSGAHPVLPRRPGALHPQRDGRPQAGAAQDHVLLLQEEAVQGGGQGIAEPGVLPTGRIHCRLSLPSHLYLGLSHCSALFVPLPTRAWVCRIVHHDMR